MNETEFIIKSFVEAAKDNIKEDGDLFITIVYNNGNEKDIFPRVTEDIVDVINNFLTNDNDVKITSKLMLKMSIGDNIVKLNEIAIK